MQKEITGWFKDLQSDICRNFENLDPALLFTRDEWGRTGGGGGLTCVMEEGKIIEKGGVNFSSVFGDIPDFLYRQFPEVRKNKVDQFYATGVSIVIHPLNPFVPIIHMNVRFFEMGNISWFGGGIDLTPHYINKADAVFFHTRLKEMCDKHHNNYYKDFKKEADDYFFIPHRNETRGVGGIFFDRLRGTENISLEEIAEFVKSTGRLFFPVYSELVSKNLNEPYGENEKHWQQLRRGRYVEFNLIYDRGTKFGLETGGRSESILMSLPPLAKWKYDFKTFPGSKEEETSLLLKKDIDWING
jgi:coproporphyrinogen III oxidase